MVLDPSNSSNLEQLALKGKKFKHAQVNPLTADPVKALHCAILV